MSLASLRTLRRASFFNRGGVSLIVLNFTFSSFSYYNSIFLIMVVRVEVIKAITLLFFKKKKSPS